MTKTIGISFRLWLISSAICALVIAVYISYNDTFNFAGAALLAFAGSFIAAFPAFIFLLVSLPFIQRSKRSARTKWELLLFAVFLACLPYGIAFMLIDNLGFSDNMLMDSITSGLLVTGGLWCCNLLAVVTCYPKINTWLLAGVHPRTQTDSYSFFTNKNKSNMTNDVNEGYSQPPVYAGRSLAGHNRILVKAGITAGLILAMLIPASYISKLVDEREERHREVVKEVSDKWASPQTVTTPYLVIPYLEHRLTDSVKQVTVRKELFIPAKTLTVDAGMQPEIRKRSIYEVLLYRSNIKINGTLAIENHDEIKPEDLLLNETELCIGITDLQGVEEKIRASFNHENYDLQPGLPVKTINSEGLSVPVKITAGQVAANIPFSLDIHLKGSQAMHFLPLSEQSTVAVSSSWANPSFDGMVLPNERDVTTKGFKAAWKFNKANLPLITQLAKSNRDEDKLSFGVSIVQPADQYVKTNRSVKYALLFIGLTFAMFFITELAQTKQVHPVQYILIGLALVIFYTLLLSIGEFTGFNIAYGIACVSTILLVGMYAVQLFKSAVVGALLGLFLGMLYGYIYVLIQLEDTALLAGSIGLFILLAVAMHFSKKIKWYPNEAPLIATV